MTSLQRPPDVLPASFVPPTFAITALGATAQIGVFSYIWLTHTDALLCVQSPRACWGADGTSFAWGKSVLATATVCTACWILSVALGLLGHSINGTSDPSIVDRLWSILPVVHVWWFWARAADPATEARLLAMGILVTVWGVRLTWNFWRKGGFSGGEDYRWIIIRQWYPGWRFEAFNLVFIVFYQLFLISAFSGGPAAVVLTKSEPLNVLDAVACVLAAALILGETIADGQMFAYQSEKYRRKRAGEDAGHIYASGFLSTGLYGVSRHPNYFCEVSLWWAVYLFSVAASGQWINWSITGPVLLTVLFVAPGASIDLAEALSSSKYPAYKAYQDRVPKCIPLPGLCGGPGGRHGRKRNVSI